MVIVWRHRPGIAGLWSASVPFIFDQITGTTFQSSMNTAQDAEMIDAILAAVSTNPHCSILSSEMVPFQSLVGPFRCRDWQKGPVPETGTGLFRPPVA